MKAITKSSRVNTALQVIQHMNSGMTVVEACRAVGMPRSTFYYIMDKNPEAMAEVQAIIDANNREQLGLILMTKTEMLCKIIEDGLSDTTKPKDRLAIYSKLNELDSKLADTLHVESEEDRRAREFKLRGPVLQLGVSRLTATQTTVTMETEE